jgi:hypothetical protein
MAQSIFKHTSMPALPELKELERIIQLGHPHLEVDVLCEIDVQHKRFPVYKLALGNPDPSCLR